jgi:hypothetical protein
MFGRGVFLKDKNFHSIVIVVPLHVSKFYRVLKKLTAWPEPLAQHHSMARLRCKDGSEREYMFSESYGREKTKQTRRDNVNQWDHS